MGTNEELLDKLRAGEERYKALVEELPAGVYMSTLERIGQFIYLSPHAERIFGRKLADFDADPSLFLTLLHPEDKEAVLEKSRRAVAELKNYSLEYRIRRNEGNGIWLRDTGRIIYDAEGSPEVVQGIVFDITLQKQEEAEYRTLLRAVEQSPNAIVISDMQARIEYVNPAFEEVTGYRQDEALGQNPRILKSNMHPPEYYREMWETLQRNEVWRGEICNKKKDGSLFWEDISISPVSGPGGKKTHYIAVKHDITDRKELEQIREDVERISRHDLKTPLGGIIGIPQLMQEDENLTEQQREYLGLIEEAGRKMLELLNRSVDLLRIERGTYEYQPAKIDAANIIRQVIADHEKLIRKKRLRVRCNSPGCCFFAEGENVAKNTIRSVYAEGEELLSYTMFGNILTNALEASPEGEEVSILCDENGKVSITIRNKGLVPQQIRDRFFEKFVTYGKKKGNGIGTYSAKLSAEVQGGEISMRSADGHTEVCIRMKKPRKGLS
jgi:PAS domain S-box-containing protein